MNRTMFTTPMIAAPPKTTPAVTGGFDPVPLIVVTVSLILPMTPAASSTPNSTPTTISHTKNSAIESTQVNFSTVHGLMWRSCRRARRGPRARSVRVGFAIGVELAAGARGAPDEFASAGPVGTGGTVAAGAAGAAARGGDLAPETVVAPKSVLGVAAWPIAWTTYGGCVVIV